MTHEKQIEIRWRDMDAYQHVNNAVYATYLEECRDEWIERALGSAERRRPVGLRARARRGRLPPGARPGGRRRARARVGLERIGGSSITLREEIRTLDGTLSAEAEAVVVARDRETGRSRPLTGDERTAFERALAQR